MTRFFRRLALAAALLALLGEPAFCANAADLKPFVRGSWKEILAAHNGRPTIIHFWGLACIPCRRELPKWGELINAAPDLPLVTINADIVEDDPEAVAAFLEKSRLGGAENWIFADGFAERLRFEIDPTWQGEVPITLLIGRDGALRKIEGAAEMGEVKAWLEEAEHASP